MFALVCKTFSDSCAVNIDLTDGTHMSHEILSLLFIDMSLTATHLFMPIRSCRVWALDVFITLEYCLTTLVASRLGCYALEMSETITVVTPLVILVVFAFAGGKANEKRMRSNWLAHSKLQEQEGYLQHQHAATARILSRLCDSLVHLGHDFRIRMPCPQLDALLFRQQTCDTNFCDFIASQSDSEMFANALRSISINDEGEGQNHAEAGMVHVSLRDSFGKVVRMHAHHACFHTANGEPRYLLGLVESGEERLPPLITDEYCSFPVPLPQLQTDLQMIVELDEADELVVSSQSPSMRTLFGELPDETKLSVICREDKYESFKGWLQNGFNHVMHHGAAHNALLFERMSFLARPVNSGMIEYEADISGCFENDDVLFVSLTLHPCRVRTQSSSSRSSEGSSSRKCRSTGSARKPETIGKTVEQSPRSFVDSLSQASGRGQLDHEGPL